MAVVVENRLLQLYQSHLDKEYQKKWKKLDQELMGYTEEPGEPLALKAKKKKQAKKKQNKKST